MRGHIITTGVISGARPAGAARRLLSYVLWPMLLAAAVTATAFGMEAGRPILWFNLSYAALAGVLLVLERAMPHERAWLEDDGETPANLAHTLLNKGLAQAAAAVAAAMAVVTVVEPRLPDYGVWPVHWPVAAQVAAALVIAEFGLYWAHRLAHEVPFLWRFHAVHHSVKRLWVINTGRFHFVDTFWSVLLSQPILWALSVPLDVLLWVTAITAFIGLLTHCNVEMRFGALSYVFNTPGLHRWHHSKALSEGNTNYGENLVLWDQLFGTFHNPRRRPPGEIGIDGPMPAGFVAQLVFPFTQRLALPLKRREAVNPSETPS